MIQPVSKWVENVLVKGENAGNQQSQLVFKGLNLTLFSLDTRFKTSTTDSF